MTHMNTEKEDWSQCIDIKYRVNKLWCQLKPRQEFHEFHVFANMRVLQCSNNSRVIMNPIMEQNLADLQLIAVVSEAYKRKLVAHKCLWYGEGLFFSPILLNVIKVTGVNVTAQFRHYWGSRCTLQQKTRGDSEHDASLCIKKHSMI